MANDPSDPVPGGDPASVAPGAGPHETDPLNAALTRPPAQAGELRASAGEPVEAPRPTNAGRVWIALAVATVLLILLIVFLAENARSVTVSFLGANGHIALALALLMAAVAGALVTLLAGTARILQLRLEVRRHRRAEPPHRPGFPAR